MTTDDGMPLIGPLASIVIPAHNEERTLGRLLDALLSRTERGEFEIVVVCNGCTDRTAEVARQHGSDVIVVEVPEPSKRLALVRGDLEARAYPRLYVDADVWIDAESVRRLAEPLGDGHLLATAPVRVIPRDGASWVVGAYYDVWEHLPQVRTGLFGRGVIAVSREGHARIRDLPPAMSDDLVMSEAFDAFETAVVPSALVRIQPPRTVADLLRRRTRVVTGVAQADRSGTRGRGATTRLSGLLRLAAKDPVLATRLPVFLAITAVARVRARRQIRAGDFDTWLRDESSRLGPDE